MIKATHTLFVSIDLRLYGRDGEYVSNDGGSYDYAFWSRYLSAFDEVGIVCRVAPDNQLADGATCVGVTGPGVHVVPMPDFTSIRSMVRQVRATNDRLRGLVDERSANHLIRAPSPLGTLHARALRRAGTSYAVEVVGDPWTVFARGAVQHPLRPALRMAQRLAMWHTVRRAHAAAYVTRETLQRRYPARRGAITASYSSIVSSGIVADDIRPVQAVRRLVTVGSLAQPYKGVDLLIRAVANLDDIELTVVGDGVLRPELEALARELAIPDRVVFRGQIERGEPVLRELERADAFVLASRTEGLPRAMLEAMSTGMACIGSDVGGIPELIPSDARFPVNDVAALTDTIRRLRDDPEFRCRIATAELDVARTYTPHEMNEARALFLQQVRDLA